MSVDSGSRGRCFYRYYYHCCGYEYLFKCGPTGLQESADDPMSMCAFTNQGVGVRGGGGGSCCSGSYGINFIITILFYVDETRDKFCEW